MTALPATTYVRTLCHQTEEPCRNCQTVFRGNFCPECGQEAVTGAPTTLEFIYEFLTRNILERGKLPRTLWRLLRYPGSLTVDFLEGRRQRSIRPVRLYLGLSVLYFLVLSLQSSSYFSEFGAQADKPVIQSGASASTSASTSANAAAQSSAPAARSGADSASAKAGKPGKPDNVDEAFQQILDDAKADQTVRQALEKANVPGALVEEIEKERKAAAAKEKKAGRPGPIIRIDNGTEFYEKWPDTGWRGELKRRIKHFSQMPQQQAQRIVVKGMLDQAPKTMFFLVPVFALLLKMIFVMRKIPYGAHLVFAFHYHALLFLGLFVLLVLPLPEPATVLTWFAMALHFPLAMRRIYGGSWAGTILRWGIMSIFYPVAIMLAMLLALIMAFLA